MTRITRQSRITRWRSAITGKFVTALYALAHPATTIKHAMQRIKKEPKK